MRLVKQTFWPPAMTSQWLICPVPLHLDTYKGCLHNCVYCFGRDITNFHRRRQRAGFQDLTANDPDRFKDWLKGIYGRPRDFTRAITVAINSRYPIKIGAISDPCPAIEEKYRTTEAFLRILRLYDYPVQIQTKNPGVLFRLLKRIGPGMNLTVSVTLISLDREWLKKIEPGAPSPEQRLEAISRIVDLGYPVMVKVQPAIWPRVTKELAALVEAIKEAGCWAFNTECLKLRQSMGKAEQTLFAEAFGNVRDLYRTKIGTREASDWVLQDGLKLEYIHLARDLAAKSGLKYFSADNTPLGHGDGFECCGTERLRDYRVFTYNLRSRAFGVFRQDDLCKCVLNFTRATTGDNSRTLGQAVDEHLRPGVAA